MSEREIEWLRRELEQAQTRAEQAQTRAEQERREKEQERREKEQERREKEQLQGQLHEAEKRTEKTTLEEYLRDCHSHVFKALRLADKDVSSTGRVTNVDNKRYPMWLRPWSDFATLQRDYFDTIQRALGDRRLFPESIAIRYSSKIASRRPAAVTGKRTTPNTTRQGARRGNCFAKTKESKAKRGGSLKAFASLRGIYIHARWSVRSSIVTDRHS